ncbi:MAG TPA: 30S ribosomal protein S16 [Candidatus Saccharimonadales bacterium]|nr:30S ribosomal protein S16 [Candidatus Saccharimonadales bacterium]
MLRIRLARRGATHRPFYRVVVNDSRSTPDARNVAELGFYDPRKSPAVLELDVEKTEDWIRKGAVPSPRVRAFLKQARTRPQSK